MSSSPDNVTQTTTSQPPGFLIPGLTTAANAALGQSGLGGFQQQLTQPLSRRELKRQKKLMKQSRKLGIPFTPNFGEGASGGFNQGGIIGGPLNNIIGGPIDSNFQPADGNTGSVNPAAGLLDQSSDLVSRTIGGEFLNPESNPFLEDTFNRAADLTQTRLASQFAGSGRNLDASLPARSEELQTLASSIFGGNFQNERDRQLTAVGQAGGLDPTNLLIQRLAGITPGAGGTSTSTQPVFRNRAGGAAGGALLGNLLFPGLGGIIGGGIAGGVLS